MNKFLEVMTEKDAYTNNGALTNSTSHNACLDLFFLAGACRKESEQNIINKLVQAYSEDRVKTLKIIFWAGDIRQGAGERRFFKLALNWLNNNHKEDLETYMSYVPEFSRWDVLFDLVDNDNVLNYICENVKTNGLLCKWLPRKTSTTDKHKIVNGDTTTITKKRRILHNGLAGKICQKLCLTPKEYRKLIVANTKVVEQQMCAKKWNEIEYAHVPSVAMNKYNKAWYRNDGERFTKYIEDVKAGKSKINASAIFPHDILKSTFYCWNWGSAELNEAQITQWNNLPNWLEGKSNSIIPVCDVSGSMSGLPICISVALGLYISERNEGVFKDAFITFSERPQMQILKGNINDRIKQLVTSKWDMNTNFVKVFELILDKAIQNRLSQDDLPKTILAISDMEFDCASSGGTNYEHIKALFERYGYKLPQIVFWNVNGRAGNVPVTVRNENVALISGASPSIIKAVLTDNISPIKIMNNAIEVERYSFIK